MRCYKRIISLYCAFAIAILLFNVDALASSDSGSEYIGVDTFWNWVAGNTDGILHAIIGYACDEVCAFSDDGYHHASSARRGGTYVDGRLTYSCTCDLCGKQFFAVETDIRQSYDNQVAELPATGVTSDGKLYYQLSHEYYQFFFGGSDWYACEHENVSDSYCEKSIPGYTVSENSDHVYSCYLSSGNAKTIQKAIASFIGSAPIDGFYTQIVSPSYSFIYTKFDNKNPYPASQAFSPGSYYADNIGYKTKGYSFSKSAQVSTSLPVRGFSFYCAPPIYEIVPLTPLDYGTDTTYNINTRPTSITGGNYGIIGDNGQIIQVTDNSSIVNEVTNTSLNEQI